MDIKTKYNIGDRIWCVYEARIKYGPTGEVSVYDDTITGIVYDKEGITYETEFTEIKEEDIILYVDADKLVEKIKELMNEIHEREKEE